MPHIGKGKRKHPRHSSMEEALNTQQLIFFVFIASPFQVQGNNFQRNLLLRLSTSSFNCDIEANLYSNINPVHCYTIYTQFLIYCGWLQEYTAEIRLI